MTKQPLLSKKDCLCALAVLMLASGCSPEALNTAAYGIFPQEQTNFKEQNYAAADYLIQQARTFIGRGDLLIAKPLSDTNQPSMSSTISKMIPEQIGIRLSQLGYRMDLSGVATGPDINYLKPSITREEKPDFVLSGTYLRRRIEMDVSLRIVDIKAGRVVASYDYILPLNRETAELSKPQPKIVRMDNE
ncbi:MAG TPA: FlgO family outer membrane protein [Alphaproteobacteria bacterium]|nr:hypothetical protein [Alphaproteobacteria bacterium]USO05107.1 MAG: hypothetical protein H6859_08085 [Rhodospirillales bacterium]HOO81510.1 FlgO family outer membrane protein [Alphaproteobacteria bacterium]